MHLKKIDKTTYQKNLNRLIIAVIAVFALGSLGIAQLLIHLFTDGEGSHFSLNATGVAIAGGVVVWLLNKYRSHPAMYEIVYVWDLKQELNRIARKQKKLLAAVANGEKNAMTIMNFSYHGSRQLYELDDNTITLDDLAKTQQGLDQTIAEHGFEISLEDYNSELLKKY